MTSDGKTINEIKEINLKKFFGIFFIAGIFVSTLQSLRMDW